MTVSAESEGREARELDQAEWSPYFEGINRRLEGGEEVWATLELVTQEIVGPEAVRMPLDSITWEDSADEIAIGLGGRGEKFPAALWHFVESPRHVWTMEDDPEESVIAIESQDSGRTLLHMYPAAAR